MKRLLFILWLTIVSMVALAQNNAPFTYKRTSRLLATTALPHQRTQDYRLRFIERFTYEGNEEAKRWYTNYYRPRNLGANTLKQREKKLKILEAYEEIRDKMLAQLPLHRHLFLADPSFNPPYGFSYEDHDGTTSLVYLEQNLKYAKGKDKIKITSRKMPVDEAVYDSIQRLHMLAVYTAIYMDTDHTRLDGTSLHFIWRDYFGDKYATDHDSENTTAKTLGKTFLAICDALAKNDRDALYALMPTVHELLAHYRTLVLPDMTLDEWELDETQRKRKN